MLTARTLTVDALKQSVVADTNRVNLCLNRLAQDGSMYALPMISVDGLEFAALPQNLISGVPTMHIFEFGSDGKQCVPSGQFTLQSGKVIFGFTRDGRVIYAANWRRCESAIDSRCTQEGGYVVADPYQSNAF